MWRLWQGSRNPNDKTSTITKQTVCKSFSFAGSILRWDEWLPDRVAVVVNSSTGWRAIYIIFKIPSNPHILTLWCQRILFFFKQNVMTSYGLTGQVEMGPFCWCVLLIPVICLALRTIMDFRQHVSLNHKNIILSFCKNRFPLGCGSIT